MADRSVIELRGEAGRGGLILLGFLAVTLLLRSSSFFQTALEVDEGIYLLVADRWLAGEGLYSTVWDNKPPGIYLLYAISQLIFGKTVLAIRISSWLAAAASCFLLYLLGWRLVGDKKAGLLAGLCYAVFSVHSQGLTANTELFYNPLVIGAFGLLLTAPRQPDGFRDRMAFRFFCVGLLLGLAFEIKYVVVFDFAAALLIAVFLIPRSERFGVRHRLSQMSLASALSAAGFLLPFLAVTAAFWLSGRYADYAQANFIANLVNSTDTSFSLAVLLPALRDQVIKNLPLWACFVLAPIYLVAFPERQGADRRHLLALLLWSGFALLGISFTKLFYSHYFLQVLPPLSLLTAYLVWRVVMGGPGLESRRRGFLLALVIGFPLLASALVPVGWGGFYTYHRWVKGERYWGDGAAKLIAHLESQIDEGVTLFAGDFSPVVYYLLGLAPPTRYAFPLMLSEPHFARVAGIDGLAELERVMAQEPTIVIKHYRLDTPFYERLGEHLARDYELDAVIDGIEVYRRALSTGGL